MAFRFAKKGPPATTSGSFSRARFFPLRGVSIAFIEERYRISKRSFHTKRSNHLQITILAEDTRYLIRMRMNCLV
jgi:hypothetical protein